MVKPNTIERAGRAVAMLIASLLMLIAVNACSKSESQQSAAKPSTNRVEKSGDALNQVTEKTKAITNEAVKSAGKMVDNVTETAKDAYDAAGNAVKKTTEKAKEAYPSADRMVSDAVSVNQTAPSATEMAYPINVPSEQDGDAVETRVNKALESVPSIPGK